MNTREMLDTTGPVLDRLTAAREAIEKLQIIQAQLVHEARYEQLPWSHIGEALGISKQAAQQRYSR
jgi:DNA-directed RNA polymerase specialized sigma24 family protein